MSNSMLNTKSDVAQYVKKAISDGTYYTTKHASTAVTSAQPASAFMSTFDPHYEDPVAMSDFLDTGTYSVSACFDRGYGQYDYLIYPSGIDILNYKTGDTYTRGSTTPACQNDCILVVSGFNQGVHGYPVSLTAIQGGIGTKFDPPVELH